MSQLMTHSKHSLLLACFEVYFSIAKSSEWRQSYPPLPWV